MTVKKFQKNLSSLRLFINNLKLCLILNIIKRITGMYICQKALKY